MARKTPITVSTTASVGAVPFLQGHLYRHKITSHVQGNFSYRWIEQVDRNYYRNYYGDEPTILKYNNIADTNIHNMYKTKDNSYIYIQGTHNKSKRLYGSSARQKGAQSNNTTDNSPERLQPLLVRLHVMLQRRWLALAQAIDVKDSHQVVELVETCEVERLPNAAFCTLSVPDHTVHTVATASQTSLSSSNDSNNAVHTEAIRGTT